MCLTFKNEPPLIMLILGDTSKQNQPIPEYYETFIEFVCIPSKRKQPRYPNFSWSVCKKPPVPLHSETTTSILRTLQQDLSLIMLISGAKAKQNQPIPELSDTFTKFVCSPSKGKHTAYPYLRCCVWTKATCPREAWNLHNLSLYLL